MAKRVIPDISLQEIVAIALVTVAFFVLIWGITASYDSGFTDASEAYFKGEIECVSAFGEIHCKEK